MSEGEFYTGGFVLCNFNETVTFAHYAWPPWDQIDVLLYSGVGTGGRGSGD